MATSQTTKNAITLKGSATIISEYLSKFTIGASFQFIYCFKLYMVMLKITLFQIMESTQYCSNVVFIQPNLLKVINSMV